MGLAWGRYMVGIQTSLEPDEIGEREHDTPTRKSEMEEKSLMRQAYAYEVHLAHGANYIIFFLFS